MNLTGSHAAVGEVVAGQDLVLIHLSEHPGLPQVWDQDARSHPQGDPVAVVVDQFPQFLLAHLFRVRTLTGHTLPCHPEFVCVCVGGYVSKSDNCLLLLRRQTQLKQTERTHTQRWKDSCHRLIPGSRQNSKHYWMKQKSMIKGPATFHAPWVFLSKQCVFVCGRVGKPVRRDLCEAAGDRLYECWHKQS